MSKKIAIVEDEPAILANYCDLFRREGYEVTGYADRPSALRGFAESLPDLAILDIGLGEEVEGGFELCRELRSRSSTLPIIFLTARDSDWDAISGLRLGADDYLTKEISLPHLSARVAALFRRQRALEAGAQESPKVRTAGHLSIDEARFRVTWRGEPVDLTITELWMVSALSRYPGQVKSRDQLMQEASILVDDPTITSYIRRIRRKFQQVDESFDAIQTVYGVGYRWNNG